MLLVVFCVTLVGLFFVFFFFLWSFFSFSFSFFFCLLMAESKANDVSLSETTNGVTKTKKEEVMVNGKGENKMEVVENGKGENKGEVVENGKGENKKEVVENGKGENKEVIENEKGENKKGVGVVENGKGEKENDYENGRRASLDEKLGGMFLDPEDDDHGNVEYKRKLVNPSPDRLEHLVTQLKWRLGEGQVYLSPFPPFPPPPLRLIPFLFLSFLPFFSSLQSPLTTLLSTG